MINVLFGKLDEWRKLPSYQLERRAYIFFAKHLPIIFKHEFNKKVIDIIPELPNGICTIEEKIPN